MQNLFKWLNALAFYGYALFLVTAGGLLGLVAPTFAPMAFEAYGGTFFQLDLPSETMNSALNQFRFMKSLEFGLGVYAFLFRKEIFTVRKHTLYFVGITMLSALSRGLSLLLDGMPHPAYLAFMAVEFSVAVIVFLYARHTQSLSTPA